MKFRILALIMAFCVIVFLGISCKEAEKAKPAGKAKVAKGKSGLECPKGMAYISPGSFMMGCSPEDVECNPDEKPAHHVIITQGFCMDKYELTQGVYQKTVGKNPSIFSSCGADCPVDFVSWDDAKSYCNNVGKRLPTEAEWEYAARGGTTTKYYWGDSVIEEYAWFERDSVGTIHAVGQKKPNSNGLYDMSGNVWEWVADWYDKRYYASSPASDPKGPDSGDTHVLRGGSWSSNARIMRNSSRNWDEHGYSYDNLGFRCARN